MKDKRVIFILIIAVGAIWGMIAYKIVVRDTDEGFIGNNKSIVHEDVLRTEVDTFSLINNYRDPFQATRKVSINSNSELKQEETKDYPKSKAGIKQLWPEITFSGLIKRKNSTERVALIKINSSDNLMRLNEEIEGIKILKMEKDSILVAFRKEKRIIYK